MYLQDKEQVITIPQVTATYSQEKRAGYSNSEGWLNTFIGNLAGYSNTIGTENTFFGDRAGYANTTGNYNTFLANQTGYSNTTGNYNTFVGYSSGNNNTTGEGDTYLGYSTGIANYTGSHNTFIGCSAGQLNMSGSSGNVFLGYEAGMEEGGSNKLYIANSDVNTLIYGDFGSKNVGINTTTPARNLHINDVMRLQPRATAPSSPAMGDIYMDSSLKKLMVYDGTTWQACW